MALVALNMPNYEIEVWTFRFWVSIPRFPDYQISRPQPACPSIVNFGNFGDFGNSCDLRSHEHTSPRMCEGLKNEQRGRALHEKTGIAMADYGLLSANGCKCLLGAGL
jgi:hypothetical protein